MTENKPKIWACLIYFNEEYYLPQALYALRHFVDGMILVDGAFEGYAEENYSTDRSNFIIREFTDDIDLHYDHKITFQRWTGNKFWKNEMEKRSYAINLVPEGDYFIIIDADELLLGDPTFFRKELYALSKKDEQTELVRNVGIVHHPADTGWFLMPRVYKKVEDMDYKGSHSNIFVGDTPVTWSYPHNNARVFRSIMIIHMNEFYPRRDKQIEKWNYQAKRESEEDIQKFKRDQLLKDITPERNDAIEKMLEAKKKTGVHFKVYNK